MKVLLVALFYVSGLMLAGDAFADVYMLDYYKPDSLFNIWSSVIFAGVIAVGAAALLVISGGASAPIVASIGGWLGGLMGLKGVAATNAGLALLGGGAIASGGFGMIGGAVVLTSALTFSGELVLDYAYSTVKREYDYSVFQKQSVNMTNFPLPKSSSGSRDYEHIVKDISELELHPEMNYMDNPVFKHAIEKLVSKHENIGLDSKESGLLALLYFYSNQYSKAYNYTGSYDSDERGVNQLIDVVNVTSELYEDDIDYASLIARFNDIANKMDSDFKVLFYTVFLDRLFYRMTESQVSFDEIEELYLAIYSDAHSKNKAAIQQSLNARAMMSVKLKQQAILSIYNNKNETIWMDPNIVGFLSRELEEYLYIVTFMRHVNSILIEEIEMIINDKFLPSSEWERNWIELLVNTQAVYLEYESGYEQLREMIYVINEHQTENNKGFFRRVLGL